MEYSPQSTVSSVPYDSTITHTMSVADDVRSQHHHVHLFNPVTPDVSPPPQMTNGGFGMKSKEPPQALELSSITNADIQEMEKVRGHLHLMLQNCKEFSDQGDYDHAPSTTADYETQENEGDKESVVSVDTTALLHRLLPNSSPLSELQVHFQTGEQVMQSHDQSGRQMVSFSGDRKLKAIPNSKVTGDKTLLSENSLLRDQVERERFRRKHCEQQIQELHGKLLEVQQQLAVAVSAERKKDAMIEQLDKTLAKVVDGWKKHEGEKVTIINQLKVERENAEQSQQRQQEMLLQFEKELAQAVEALTKEQEKAAQAEREKHTQLKQQQEERTKLLECLSKEKETVAQMEDERQKFMKEKEEMEQKYAEADEALREVRTKLAVEDIKEKKTKIIEEIESRIETLRVEHDESLSREKEKVEQEMQTVKDSQAVLASVQKEVQRLEMELDTSNREKENLKMELRLMEAKHEANRTKEETERQGELEREMTKRLQEIHEQMSKAESEMRDSHRKQLQEMNTKHKEELQQQLAKFHEELKKKDAKLKTVSEEYEDRISSFQEKMASLANTRQYLEKQRQALSLRLQQMMQAHCDEAIKLLNSSATKLSPISGTRQLSYDQGSFLQSSKDESLKWGKETERQPGKVPITAAVYSSLQLQQQQQQQQQQKIPDKSLSSLLPASKPLHSVTRNSSHADSGMFSSGSYMSMNGDTEKHGMSSHDQSSTLEFYPLHAFVDSDSPKDKEDDRDDTLMEQTLEPDNTSPSVFPLVHETHDERHVTSAAAQDIAEKLEEQESRQAELNHYVKMLLQRSPGDQHYEEKGQMPNGLMYIPSSAQVKVDSRTSSGVISPIQSDHQIEQRHVSSSLYPAVMSVSQLYQDSKTKGQPAQAAFTQTTVTTGAFNMPAQTRKDVSFTRQIPSQLPHSRLTQVAPHTPPRRERDSDNQPPPSAGALTPQQVGQLSRMLGLFSGPGQPQFTAEQLYAYLRGVQERPGAGNDQTSWSSQHPVSTMGHTTQEQHVSGPGHKGGKDSPPQASHRPQTGPASKARRSLDTNIHRKQKTKIIEEIESRIETLRVEHDESLSREKEKVEQEMQTVKDSQAVLASVQKEVQRLEMELDTSNREKENLKMELRLMEAKHEANRTKEETERQGELEREMTKRLQEIHEQMSKAESEMRDSHRKQLQEMNTKHKEELQQQLAKFHEELKKKDAKLKTVSGEYEDRISSFQEKMASLANTRQYLEKERQALSLRLQQMMQAHCDEAIKLLKSSATKLSPISGTRQLSYDQGSFLQSSKEESLKWGKETERQPGKVPITAAVYSSLQLQQQQQQQQQQQKIPDRSLSSLLPASKPLHSVTRDSSHADSGMFSSGSYMSMNGDTEKHGMSSHDQSTLEFYPLHAFVDSDSPKDKENDRDDTLMEQTLEPDNTSPSVFPLVHETHEERHVMSAATQDIAEKLEEQESRQAELNHYVKMLLQRSPGDQHYEEKDQMPNGLMCIPSSAQVKDSRTSSGVISPIQSDHQIEQRHVSSSLYPAVMSVSQPYQDSKTKGQPTQAAFTKTTVTTGAFNMPQQTRKDVSFTSQIPSQLPHSRLTQVAPHTPPRRERDSDNQPPPSAGALTPQQVGQLSRMLGLFSGPGQTQFTAEQLYAYLRGVQERPGAGNDQTSWSSQHPVSTMGHTTQEQHVSGPGHKGGKDSPPQASHRPQTGPASKARRSLDTNIHRKQVQGPHTQGPSVNGHPIPPPGGQATKSTEQPGHAKVHKQPAKQVASHFGPPLRYTGGPPGVPDGAKPTAKAGQQVKETKKLAPAGKQQKINAWR